MSSIHSGSNKSPKSNSADGSKQKPAEPADPFVIVIKVVLTAMAFLAIWYFKTLFDIDLPRPIRAVVGLGVAYFLWQGVGSSNGLVIRETIESFAVALILLSCSEPLWRKRLSFPPVRWHRH